MASNRIEFGNPTTVAQRRIQGELKEWRKNPPEGCSLESCDPLTEWVILMAGPESPAGIPKIYEGKTYKIRIKFTNTYPLESPEVIFLPEAPIHPHIYTNGHICLDILYDGCNGGWSPALTVTKVCLSLRSMLASNTEKRRPTGDSSYVKKVGNNSPKMTSWMFDDDTV